MVNALQMIVLAVYFDLLLPTNIKAILVAINKTCNFDLFKTDDIYAELFGFEDTESFSEKFEENGLDGSNFIIGIGPILLFVIYFPVWVIIHFILRKIYQGEQRNKCIKKIIKPQNFLVIFIIFLIESCLELGLTGIISVYMVSTQLDSHMVQDHI